MPRRIRVKQYEFYLFSVMVHGCKKYGSATTATHTYRSNARASKLDWGKAPLNKLRLVLTNG